RPRHLEVQVFGDHHGQLVHLFERDCSVQRRHQKIVEEAPAPALTLAQRQALSRLAIDAARAVNYSGAGTVEFIAAADGQCYFMEMNTRLQVEHAVTEFVTGQDLVEWQFRVAAGERLPLTQEQISLSGHAIEARLCAEDPARDFLPATGTLSELKFPAEGNGIRVDTGVQAGDAVTIHYDPLLAKLIVHGPDRASAVRLLQNALAATRVAGVRTNRDFLLALASHPAFVAGAVNTGFIETYGADLLRSAPAEALIPRDGAHRDPWGDAGGWRLNGAPERRAAAGAAVGEPGVGVAVAVMGPMTAPMPGRVTALNVRVGDRVRRGAVLLVLEAMKMEHAITSPADGVISQLNVALGDPVDEGVELLVISPE
ncbi:MAG: biotin/lipoyl-containing protein, partial [Gammaproteobacteria bacterium]